MILRNITIIIQKFKFPFPACCPVGQPNVTLPASLLAAINAALARPEPPQRVIIPCRHHFLSNFLTIIVNFFAELTDSPLVRHSSEASGC
ncbi:hypothetical protein [Candidatus Pantoea soli]|uniref:hypothetical protein n=1 Tax=Candidatus Pantoea soli TaxID=3098669 RepID=UPI0011A4171E|nr:hypothetical protein [Pantoea soli]